MHLSLKCGVITPIHTSLRDWSRCDNPYLLVDQRTLYACTIKTDITGWLQLVSTDLLGLVAPAAPGNYRFMTKYFDYYTKFKAVYFIDEGQSIDDSGQNWCKTSSCFSKFTSIACVPMAAASSLPTTTATTARLRRSCSNLARPTLQSTTVSANGTGAQSWAWPGAC